MKKYIKSQLNYTGGKYKLLDNIIPLFPKHIDTFVDLFGGGFNVGINVEAKKIKYNELCPQVVELMEFLNNNPTNELLENIDSIISKYKLSKENREGFLKLRENYNKDPNPLLFYTMVCYSFNNQIRFNKNGEYNMPFGKDKSSFNPSLRKNFTYFCDRLHEIKPSLTNLNFSQFDFYNLSDKDLVYCDPPYYNSVAAYNERDGWAINNEIDLLNLLDELNNNGIKFALSNNLKYDNPILNDWKEKYNVHYIEYDYSNCNYHKKDKNKDIEVLITNY